MVFYCVFFGENESITSQGIYIDRITSEKVIYNAVFLKISLYNKAENVNKTRKARKGKQCKYNSEGKTVLNSTRKKIGRLKWTTLKSRRGSNIGSSQTPLEKLINFIFWINLLNFLFTSTKASPVNLIMLRQVVLFGLKFITSLNANPGYNRIKFVTKFKRTKRNNRPKLSYPTDEPRSRPTNLLLSCRDERKDNLITKTLLLRGGIESNPGPQSQTNLMDILTFNCNGLGDPRKMKRVIEKSSKITNKGGMVMLQETHIVKEDSISLLYKGPFSLNGYKTNSAGVITLLGPEYVILFSHKDEKGRQLHLVVQKGDDKFLVVNVHCPNDHNQSKVFIDSVYTKILDILNSFPDCFIVLGGDFNACMTEKDYLNRNKLKPELELTTLITQLNKTCSLTDSYRYLNQDPGFTWSRGVCYSRLDYVFVSKALINQLKKATIDWSFDKSDHGALITSIQLNPEFKRGPGIVKVNPEVLDDPIKLGQIRNELIFLISQIPEDWNGHKKLDYLKVIIQSTMGKYTGIKRSEIAEEISSTELSLNEIEKLRLKVVQNKEKNSISTFSTQENEQRFQQNLNKVDTAKRTILNNLEILRKQLEDTKFLNARAKWYEFGEKSNKFFLSLNKFRSKQSIIRKIKDEDREFIGQERVTEGITNFYSNLYRKAELPEVEDDSFFDLCPKLSETNKLALDKEISIEEMYKALKSCQESAPGPDGIPYKVYKVFWKEISGILKESWDFSNESGELPHSHKESVIVIIPKEGKNPDDIKNWRPITLSNCDAKIITKALAMRVNPVLESIIDPSQTAYVPGRSVMDNIRSNKFLKAYCRSNKISALLTSLHAKKAFDSVDYKYIDTILDKYGFGITFRNYFKLLYKDISAKILINGYFSSGIQIERGVKQGDALSCAIFILCIDPLLRNINHNKKISHIKIKLKPSTNSSEVIHKACGFADDVSVICMDDKTSLNQIFHEYQRLTDKSGLSLNADKTEILILNPNSESKSFQVHYEKKCFSINSTSSIKICGIYFCKDVNDEYNLNVNHKINKLVNKLKVWSSRHLTLEGKALILKTFGISQLIYNMQCTRFEQIQLKEIERYIFNFIWGTKDMENSRARDRIKRSVMKNSYELGGLNITDIECLDRSLKLRQFIRASSSKHPISSIQSFCSNGGICNKVIHQEFKSITSREEVCTIAQESINILTDVNRKNKFQEKGDSIESSKAIEQISMTDIDTFLTRQSRVFLKCIYKPFRQKGIITYLDLVREAETEMDGKTYSRLKSIINAFQDYF